MKKAEFDKMTVSDIVKEVKDGYAKVHENSKLVMERLHYLESSSRYKEVKGFAKQEFKAFLWEVCHIPYNRYRQLWSAFQFFPKESETYGPHVVQTIREGVGVTKTPKVLKAIDIEFKKTGKIPSRQFVATTIEKHAPPKPVTSPVDTKSYWRDRAQKAEGKLKAAEKRIADLEAQVSRNKPFVEASLVASKALQDLPHLNA